VLVGTIYPLLAQAVTNRKVSVGAPFFDRNVVPLALLLLFLMAVGPLVPWRAGSSARLLARLRGPAWAAALVAVILAVTRAADPGTILVFGLVAFVAVATIGEMARGVRAFARAHGGSIPSAIAGAVRRDRRLYGGLLVHVGLLVAVVGITTSAVYDRQTEMTLRTGQTASFAGFALRFDGVRTIEQPQRRVIVATLSVTDASDHAPVVVLTPSLNLYPGATEPIGTPSISKGTPANRFRDLYTALQSREQQGKGATFRLYLNPGVFWLWVGGGVMVLGGVVALWSVKKRQPAPRPKPPPVPERVGAAL
jgi:cytochrome c-type biogenesis protein CcmF